MSINVAQFTKATVESVTAEKEKFKKLYNDLLIQYGKGQQQTMQLQTELALLKEKMQNLQLGEPMQTDTTPPFASQESTPAAFTPPTSS